MVDVEGRIVLAERFDAAQELFSNDLFGSEITNNSGDISRFNGYIVFPVAFLFPRREKYIAVGSWQCRRF
jgi:hypothetical protein